WVGKSIHEIGKRDVVEVIEAIVQRGAPVAANKTLKSIKTFLRWCVGRAVLDQSPAEGVPAPGKEVARDRVLTDDELARVILAARKIGGPYDGIVELLALTKRSPSCPKERSTSRVGPGRSRKHERRTVRRMSCTFPLNRWWFFGAPLGQGP